MAEAQPDAPVGIVCGGGTMPFAIADALIKRGRKPVLFPLKGFADSDRIAAYTHHWMMLGQVGRFVRLARNEGCRDLIFIGSLVRPAFRELRIDWGALRMLPLILKAFRGGDDHLLASLAKLFEREGFRLVDVRQAVPDVLLPAGNLTQRAPTADEQADIDYGLSALAALSRFDVGQALVVIDRHIVAVEDIEGTDGLLARVARLRREGRLRAPMGRGLLIKAPKVGQDMRLDLPTLGPRTVAGVAEAGLVGIAVVAGNTLIAEPAQVVRDADRAGVFIVGLTDQGSAS